MSDNKSKKKIKCDSIEMSELMDDYILGRLSEGEKKSFEGHYLHCDKCFQALQSREKILLTLREEGNVIFPNLVKNENRIAAWKLSLNWPKFIPLKNIFLQEGVLASGFLFLVFIAIGAFIGGLSGQLLGILSKELFVANKLLGFDIGFALVGALVGGYIYFKYIRHH